MSCDPKFRQDSAYIFFLLLVKELIQLKRCKTTYLRQATRLPNLSKEDIVNVDHANLSRFKCTGHLNVLGRVKEKCNGFTSSEWLSITLPYT